MSPNPNNKLMIKGFNSLLYIANGLLMGERYYLCDFKLQSVIIDTVD